MSLVGDLIAVLDPVLGQRVYRHDQVPDNATVPYASIIELIADSPALRGDSNTLARRRMMQVDLWQAYPLPPGEVSADVHDAIDGAKGSGAALRFWVSDHRRPPEPGGVLTHDAFTVEIARRV